MTYTKDSLDQFRLKAEVVELAEKLGIDSSGTREEVEDRIIAEQPSEPDASAPEAPAPEGRRARRDRLALVVAENASTVEEFCRKNTKFDANGFVLKLGRRTEFRAGQPYQVRELLETAILKGQVKLEQLQ